MKWVKPYKLPAYPDLPLPRSYYRRIDIAEFQDFPPDRQEAINTLCFADRPPPPYVKTELFMAPARAFAEWHLRRGHNPEAVRDRSDIEPWMRDRVIELHGMVCWLCSGPIPHRGDLHMDHVHPKSLGGEDTVRNLRPAHARCNIRRGNRTPEEFRRRLASESALGTPEAL